MLIPFETHKHTKLIADLHYNALSWSTSSQLGKDHILKIYKALSELDNTFGYVWMHENELVGYVIGTTNYAEARAKIKSAFSYKDILKIILKSIFKPIYFVNAFETVFIIPKYLEKCGTKSEWLAWNTNKAHPKHKIAAIQCYYALKKHYLKNNEKKIIAQIEKRSKESEAFLLTTKDIIKKHFFQNKIYLIKLSDE